MPGIRLTRRRFLQLTAAAASTGAAGFGYVRTVEPNWVDLEPVTLALPRLAEQLSGLRIAQLSDIHLSRFTSPAKLLNAVEQVNRIQPDLVMLTGDFVGRDAAFATGMIEPLRRLDAPAFAVYGNHDLWSDRAAVGAALAETSPRQRKRRSGRRPHHRRHRRRLVRRPATQSCAARCALRQHQPAALPRARLHRQRPRHRSPRRPAAQRPQPRRPGAASIQAVRRRRQAQPGTHLAAHGTTLPDRPLPRRKPSALYEPRAGRLAPPLPIQLPPRNHYLDPTSGVSGKLPYCIAAANA